MWQTDRMGKILLGVYGKEAFAKLLRQWRKWEKRYK